MGPRFALLKWMTMMWSMAFTVGTTYAWSLGMIRDPSQSPPRFLCSFLTSIMWPPLPSFAVLLLVLPSNVEVEPATANHTK